MQEINVKPLSENFQTPNYATLGSSGADLYAITDLILYMGEINLVSLGFALELPQGLEAQIRPRSSAAKNGILIPNSPATIDSDYRGDVKVLMLNVQEKPYYVHVGDKIAQMVIKPVHQVEFNVVEKINETLRSDGGFGSTGR